MSIYVAGTFALNVLCQAAYRAGVHIYKPLTPFEILHQPPWQQVRDRVLSLLPVTLQNSLHKESDIMGSCRSVPLLANDAHIIRKTCRGSTRQGCLLHRTSYCPTLQMTVMRMEGW